MNEPFGKNIDPDLEMQAAEAAHRSALGQLAEVRTVVTRERARTLRFIRRDEQNHYREAAEALMRRRRGA